MTIGSLYVNRMLNYDEVVRRLKYWAGTESNREQQYRTQAIQILASALWRERDNLYFESRIKHEVAQ